MFLSYSAIPDFVNALVCFACFMRLWKTLRATTTPSRQTYHFRDAYFFLIFAYLGFSLPVFFAPTNTLLLGVFYSMANGLLFLAAANLLAIPVSFFRPRLHTRMFRGALAVSAVLVVMGLITLPEPQVNFFLRITDWNADPLLDILYGIWLGIALLCSVFFFIQQSILSRNRDVRIRAFFIGSGLSLLLVSTIAFYILDLTYEPVYTNTFAVVGFLITMIGVYYRPKKTDEPFLPSTE